MNINQEYQIMPQETIQEAEQAYRAHCWQVMLSHAGKKEQLKPQPKPIDYRPAARFYF